MGHCGRLARLSELQLDIRVLLLHLLQVAVQGVALLSQCADVVGELLHLLGRLL